MVTSMLTHALGANLLNDYGVDIDEASIRVGADFAAYRYPLIAMTSLDPKEFPVVNSGGAWHYGPKPFEPYHATLGCNVPAILASRLVRRSTRSQSTLDGKYSVCLTSFRRALIDYTSTSPKFKTMFEFNIKKFKKSKNFKKTQYLYAHEPWLMLEALIIVSRGDPVLHADDFITTDGVFRMEPPERIPPEHVSDDWAPLSDGLLLYYGGLEVNGQD
jgi:hypothetical protein